jgi:hypothetical protein
MDFGGFWSKPPRHQFEADEAGCERVKASENVDASLVADGGHQQRLNQTRIRSMIRRRQSVLSPPETASDDPMINGASAQHLMSRARSHVSCWCEGRLSVFWPSKTL